jgi:hypothetical protein
MNSTQKIFIAVFIFSILLIGSCSKEENPIPPLPNPSINIIYPNGGENLLTNTPIKIRWTSKDVDFVNIEFSDNNGNNWIKLANSIKANLGEWEWMTPNSFSENCKIKVLSTSAPSINDESDSSFSIIINVDIELLIPNGGEIWESLTDYGISWNSENIDSILIEFTSDNGNVWHPIDTVDASISSYTWETNYQPSDKYKVRVSSLHQTSLNDDSDNNFTIYLSPRVTESLDYYPLALGNKWFYKKTIIEYPDTDIIYLNREVTDYVLLENDKYYFLIISGENPYNSYERLDSLQGLVFGFNPNGQENEYVLDDLITEPPNIVYARRFWNGQWPYPEIVDEKEEVILGINTITRFYLSGTIEYAAGYNLSKKIGLTGWWSIYFAQVEVEVIGAVIDGVVYGDTTTTITPHLK